MTFCKMVVGVVSAAVLVSSSAMAGGVTRQAAETFKTRIMSEIKKKNSQHESATFNGAVVPVKSDAEFANLVKFQRAEFVRQLLKSGPGVDLNAPIMTYEGELREISNHENRGEYALELLTSQYLGGNKKLLEQIYFAWGMGYRETTSELDMQDIYVLLLGTGFPTHAVVLKMAIYN